MGCFIWSYYVAGRTQVLNLGMLQLNKLENEIVAVSDQVMYPFLYFFHDTAPV